MDTQAVSSPKGASVKHTLYGQRASWHRRYVSPLCTTNTPGRLPAIWHCTASERISALSGMLYETCVLALNQFNGMMVIQAGTGDLTMAIGKFLVITGAVLLVIGVILIYAPWLINWFGRLPGDIRIEDDNKRVYVPLVSMLIVSIVLTLIVNLFFRR